MRAFFLCAFAALVLGMSACSTSTDPVVADAIGVDETNRKNEAAIQKRTPGPTIVGSVDVRDCETGEIKRFDGQESSITSNTAAGRSSVTTFTGHYTSATGLVLTTKTTKQYRRPNYNQKTGAGMCPYTLTVTYESSIGGVSTFTYRDVIEYDANCDTLSYRREYETSTCP